MQKRKAQAIEINSKIGRWFIIKQVESIRYGHSTATRYLCKCECGTEKIVRATTLRSGRSSQCRNCRDKERYIDIDSMTGTKIGKWLILRGIKNEKRPLQRSLLCKCECGKELIIEATRLKNKKTMSCRICSVLKHGYDRTPTYRSWEGMKCRCNKKKHVYYKYYGGRGITYCERWEIFENFLEDMGERPSGKQLDRIDNNGNYEPKNCHWVTPKENSNNRRKRKIQ